MAITESAPSKGTLRSRVIALVCYTSPHAIAVSVVFDPLFIVVPIVCGTFALGPCFYYAVLVSFLVL